ncbi:MAG TPA: hypothetical protein ENH82_10530 [bacterium]|nr:hypothetical protein [bacterium]
MTYYEAIRSARKLAVRDKRGYVVLEYISKHWWNRTRYGVMWQHHYSHGAPYEPHVIRLTIAPNGIITQ